MNDERVYSIPIADPLDLMRCDRHGQADYLQYMRQCAKREIAEKIVETLDMNGREISVSFREITDHDPRSGSAVPMLVVRIRSNMPLPPYDLPEAPEYDFPPTSELHYAAGSMT